MQPRRQPGDGSAEKKREIPTKRTGETTYFFPAHREKPRVWALESHATDNFTLRTMGGVHTCQSLRNVQQICCSAQTGQHSRLQCSCCPVWALQHIHVFICLLYSMYILYSMYSNPLMLNIFIFLLYLLPLCAQSVLYSVLSRNVPTHLKLSATCCECLVRPQLRWWDLLPSWAHWRGTVRTTLSHTNKGACVYIQYIM